MPAPRAPIELPPATSTGRCCLLHLHAEGGGWREVTTAASAELLADELRVGWADWREGTPEAGDVARAFVPGQGASAPFDYGLAPDGALVLLPSPAGGWNELPVWPEVTRGWVERWRHCEAPGAMLRAAGGAFPRWRLATLACAWGWAGLARLSGAPHDAAREALAVAEGWLRTEDALLGRGHPPDSPCAALVPGLRVLASDLTRDAAAWGPGASDAVRCALCALRTTLASEDPAAAAASAADAAAAVRATYIEASGEAAHAAVALGSARRQGAAAVRANFPLRDLVLGLVGAPAGAA